MQKDMSTQLIDFQNAMLKYENNPFYARFSIGVAVVVLLCQLISVWNCLHSSMHLGLLRIVIIWIAAYIATDFINGLVHLYMDNNTHYTSIVGPLIAAFHLHHLKLKYTVRHPILVYFYESGYKIWLAFYLILLCGLQYHHLIQASLSLFLVLFGILSSFAEVSHYWCHHATKRQVFIKRLQQTRILLSKPHHRIHHQYDNTHYAFLNGVTDPVINFIARRWFRGYKHHADKHVEAYLTLFGITTSRRTTLRIAPQ